MRAPRRVLLLTVVALLVALSSASDDEAPSTVTPKSERVTPLGGADEAAEGGDAAEESEEGEDAAPEALDAPDEEAPPPPPAAPADDKTAKVQFMVTNQMREQLSALGYTAAEVATLDPQRAAAIIDKQIRRPSQGMPSKWAKKSGGGGLSLGALGGLVGKLGGGPRVGVALAASTVCALALTGKLPGGGGGGAKKVTRAKRVTPPEQLLDPGSETDPAAPAADERDNSNDLWLVRRAARRIAARPPAARLLTPRPPLRRTGKSTRLSTRSKRSSDARPGARPAPA